MDARLNPYRLYRNITTGETSHNMHEVLPHTLTLRSKFTTDVFGTWDGAPFVEVETIPIKGVYGEFCPWYATAQHPPHLRTLPHIIDAIVAYLHSRYDWSKFHIIYASSGYDSRIISAALRRLYDEAGRAPNDIIFISNIWERDSFLATGKAIGWPESTYIICNPDLDEDHYFGSHILDFANLWRKVNAPCPFPINLWYYLTEYAQTHDLCPSDDAQLQGIGGYWANEVFDCFQSIASCAEWIKRHSSWYYYNVMAALPFKCGGMLFPLATAEVILHLPAMDATYLNGNAVRKALSDLIAPSTVAIPKLSCDDRRHYIAPDIVTQMIAKYDSSWYNHHIQPRTLASSNTEFSHWWSAYTMASLCEHLVNTGYDINVR